MSVRSSVGRFWKIFTDTIEAISGTLTLSGALAISGALTALGTFIVGANKFIVSATTGNTTCAGTFVASGAITASEGVALLATAADGVTVLLKDAQGKALLATGTAVPADAGAIYAKGCLFIDTDVATGTSGLYVNIGTAASCVFKLVSNAA